MLVKIVVKKVSTFRCKAGQDSFINDIALLKLADPVPKEIKPIQLCEERLPYSSTRHILGTCGVGSTSKRDLIIPTTLQETVFYESMYISESSPFSFQWCRDDLVCVDAITKG